MHLRLHSDLSPRVVIVPLADFSKVDFGEADGGKCDLHRTILIDGSKDKGVVVPGDYVCDLYDGSLLVETLMGIEIPEGFEPKNDKEEMTDTSPLLFINYPNEENVTCSCEKECVGFGSYHAVAYPLEKAMGVDIKNFKNKLSNRFFYNLKDYEIIPESVNVRSVIIICGGLEYPGELDGQRLLLNGIYVGNCTIETRYYDKEDRLLVSLIDLAINPSSMQTATQGACAVVSSIAVIPAAAVTKVNK